jgi:hypothetical protein
VAGPCAGVAIHPERKLVTISGGEIGIPEGEPLP